VKERGGERERKKTVSSQQHDGTSLCLCCASAQQPINLVCCAQPWFLNPAGKMTPWTGRFWTLLDPTYAKKVQAASISLQHAHSVCACCSCSCCSTADDTHCNTTRLLTCHRSTSPSLPVSVSTSPPPGQPTSLTSTCSSSQLQPGCTCALLA
jgi:hypothetical protein